MELNELLRRLVELGRGGASAIKIFELIVDVMNELRDLFPLDPPTPLVVGDALEAMEPDPYDVLESIASDPQVMAARGDDKKAISPATIMAIIQAISKILALFGK